MFLVEDKYYGGFVRSVGGLSPRRTAMGRKWGFRKCVVIRS